MKKMHIKDESRCWDCGEHIFFGNGYYLGDENPDVRVRSLCNKCIDKLAALRKGG